MNEAALYIHVPFCAKKCMYCDFPSFCGKESLMLDYTKALSVEIENCTKDKKIRTIFIGGGTPTYLSFEALEILKECIGKISREKEDEFTVECNPGTITEEKLRILKEMGVNRLSIGLQAWQDSLLNELGRIHTLEQFLQGYYMARSAGFNNINIDIMFGLPNQKLEQWRETLDQVINLSPEHISCYSLIIEEGTTFYNLYSSGRLAMPDEETEREMYNMALKLFRKNGYDRYEISNFSKKGKECKHNIVYWTLKNYIGAGAAAHSYLNGKRYRNEEKIEEYIKKIRQSNDPVVEIIENAPKDEMEEFMFMGLRMTNGISTEDFYMRFAVEVDEIYGDIISKHEKNELILRDKNRIFLSNKGIELSNMVMSDFIL